MKDLNKFFDKCLQMCIDCSIPVNKKSTKIFWNSRAKRRWGQCKRDLFGYEISISTRLRDDNCPDKALEETILHELCHATPTGHNHTGDWKKYVNRLNKKYGYNIKRVDSDEDKGVEKDKRLEKVKYRFKCQGCGLIVERYKVSNFTRHYERYRCSKCKSVFKPI